MLQQYCHTGKKKAATRASKLSVIELLERKFCERSELKEKELELRKMDLELMQQQMDREDKEREENMKDKKKQDKEREKRMELEFAERKAMLELLQKLATNN